MRLLREQQDCWCLTIVLTCSLDGIKLLLANGADPNVPDKDGETPFTIIVESGMVCACLAVLQVPLDSSCSARTSDTNRYQHNEAQAIKAAQLLMGSGRLNPNIKAKGLTALHKALHLEWDDLALCIVQSCPTLDLSLTDTRNCTAIERAMRALPPTCSADAAQLRSARAPRPSSRLLRAVLVQARSLLQQQPLEQVQALVVRRATSNWWSWSRWWLKLSPTARTRSWQAACA